MLSYYCLKCRKNIKSKNPNVARTKNGRRMLLSNCVICDNRKSEFSNQQFNTRYKINKIVHNFLLAWDKFMPEMNLKQPGFAYSACTPFTKSI